MNADLHVSILANIDSREVCVMGEVLFDQAVPGFYIEDFSITDDDGAEIEVSDSEEMRLCASLVAKYFEKELQ